MIFLLPIALLGLYFIANKSEGDDLGKRLYDIKDIEPENQGGSYKRDYDLIFKAAADEFKVPFALLKAHSIKESSINPSAYLDENPKKLKEREGWASRGLLQILWWPGSNRFAKYGYTDKDLGVDALRLFDPNVNVRIGAQLMRDNIIAARGNVRDAINMHNTGKKESVFAAPGNYTGIVYGYYQKIIKEV